jgi:hypothetical protein
MTRLRDIYGPGFTQAEYLRALAAGYETGWWDDNGVPAPWARRLPRAHSSHDTRAEPRPNGDEPPF